jgi:ABC-type uncharacterized transport system fused permease/ATPase subunit
LKHNRRRLPTRSPPYLHHRLYCLPAAFNHILSDVSLVVYQFEALAGFSAVIDRLGEFSEVLGGCK